jgi:hypothetical protein
MGSIILDIEKLNNFFVNPDNRNSWENKEIEKFIQRAFLIGKDKTVEDVFEKELGLISLQFDHYEFFKLSKNKNAVQFFNKYIKEKEDFDDVLFDLAENNYSEFYWLYDDNYHPPIERPKLEISASEPEPIENSNAIFKNIYEKEDQPISEVVPIITEIEAKIEFTRQILYQLELKRDTGQENLLNDNVKNLIQSHIYKRMKEGVYPEELSYWEKLLNSTSAQIEEANVFFNDDYNRTREFFERTLSDLENLKDQILNIDLNEFGVDKNFSSNLNERFDDSFSVEMSSVYPGSYDFEEEIPETLEETLVRLTRKINITITKDLFVNTFAMDRFFTYDKDITKMKSDVLPIIEEWEEE